MNSHNSEELHIISQDSSKFGFSLYNKVSSPGENTVLSIFTIVNLLLLIRLGAKKNTLQDINHALNITEDIDFLQTAYLKLSNLGKLDKNSNLAVANGIFISNSSEINQTFINDASKYFSSDIEYVNFSDIMGSTKIINDWVSYQTHEKIQDMISENSICPETVSVLISALYFKGEWLEKFDPNLTMKQRFHVSPEETIEVPTMLAEMDIAPVHNDELKSTVIALPYRGNRMIMYILLPMDTFGLSELETKISSDSFDPSILDKITGIKKATKLYLPKFKIESTHDMKEGLRQQGIIDLFSRKCDLSGVGGTPGEIYASEVFQKAVIHVNEEGSEMTGATSMTLVPCSLVDVESLAVDHPFLFIIKDRETGLILFLGRVVRP